MKTTKSCYRDAIPALERLRALGANGGPAHVVIEDGNLADIFIQDCLRDCDENPFGWSEAVRDAARELLQHMNGMSMTQRRKIYNYRSKI
jgi:hypothetical protein